MKKYRRLNAIEASMASTHALLGGTTQVVSLLSFRGSFDQQRLISSFERLFTAHEILRLSIVEDENSFEFRGEVDFPRVERMLEATSEIPTVERLLEKELNSIIDPKIGLWRYRIITDSHRGLSHLLFTRHHAISDGYTTLRLMRDLLAYYSTGTPIAPELLSIGADKRIRSCRRAPFLQKAAGNQRIQPSRFPFAEFVPIHLRSTRVESRKISGVTLAELSASAKVRGQTLNSQLVAIFARAVGEEAALDVVNVFTAVSLRKQPYSETQVSDLGCFITVSDVAIELSSLECIAQRYGKSISKHRDTFVPSFREHADIRASVKSRSSSSEFQGIAVTNVGSADQIQEASALEIVDYRSVANRNGGLFAMALHLSFLRGELTISLTYPTLILADGMAERVLNKMVAYMETIQ